MEDEKESAIAAIDAGTNSFHLVVAKVLENGEMQILDRSKELVRLGKSDTYGDFDVLSDKALKRGRNAIERFANIAKSYNAKVYAVATSGIREARNHDRFISSVAETTGVNLEIISGKEECRLIYNGTIHSLDIFNEKVLVIDIGGGSTETVAGFKGETEFSISTKIGTLRLANMFFPDNICTIEKCENCREYIRWIWTPVLERIRRIAPKKFVGTSGTIAAISKIILALKNQPIPDNLNCCTISQKDILTAVSLITNAKTVKERAAIPGMEPERADIITEGALILEFAVKELDIKEITYSAFALREGLVFDIFNRKATPESRYNPENLRRDSVYNLCRKYKINLKHAEYVKNISDQLFTRLENIHKLDAGCREILAFAAELHDIGYFISHDQHHKHSYYLISKSLLPGFTNDETEMMGLIARYHRKGMPTNSQPEYERLSTESKHILCILAGILRIAEGIDRRRIQLITGISDIKVAGGNILIILTHDKTKLFPDIEIWGANHRTDLLESALGYKISIILQE